MHICWLFNTIHVIKVREHIDYCADEYGTSLKKIVNVGDFLCWNDVTNDTKLE
jgi:tryptophanase